jgi:hypothetical protein
MSATINVREAGNMTIVEVAGRVTLGRPDHPFKTLFASWSTACTRISSSVLAVSRTSTALVSVS